MSTQSVRHSIRRTRTTTWTVESRDGFGGRRDSQEVDNRRDVRTELSKNPQEVEVSPTNELVNGNWQSLVSSEKSLYRRIHIA